MVDMMFRGRTALLLALTLSACAAPALRQPAVPVSATPMTPVAPASVAATQPALTATVQAEEALHPGMTYRRLIRGDGTSFVAHVVELDLTRGDLAFRVTPGDRSRGMEYVAMTTSSFLNREHALLAFNASYFLPFAGGSPGGDDFYPHEGDPVNASGAVIADGVTVSPAETDLDLRVNAIVCFNRLRVLIADGQACPRSFPSGVAAGPRLLADNMRQSFAAFDNNYAVAAHPRTAMGISADGRRGWIIIVDGRQRGYSVGASLTAMTDLFVELGASNAINLDGGGSAALVAAGSDGAARLLNRPIHVGVPGRERPVANHIAIVRAR